MPARRVPKVNHAFVAASAAADLSRMFFTPTRRIPAQKQKPARK